MGFYATRNYKKYQAYLNSAYKDDYTN